jgi:serine/threonine protein phosphatase 1
MTGSRPTARAPGDAGAPVVHLGDLVDRGPDSAGVIDYLMRGQDAGRDWVVLKGNHDRMFSTFLADPTAQDPGLRKQFSYLHPNIGGAATLEAYGVRSAADRPVARVHADAVAAVPRGASPLPRRTALASRTRAGALRPCRHPPGVPLQEQTETDLVWIRGPFLEHPDPHPWLIVHGHTAIEAPRHYGNRVNIDSRAAYGGPSPPW